MKKNLRGWLDDERPAPEGWVSYRWPQEMIADLHQGILEEINLDHDLGDDDRGTGYDVLSWIEESVFDGSIKRVPTIRIHTANPSARDRMEASLAAIERFKVRNELPQN